MVMTSPPYYQMKDYDHNGQLGLEDDVQEYISDLCDVLEELKRVLKDDGIFFLNIDDTYYRKSLRMIPERLALELKERGWILRNKIIWHKNACMPESVKDRFSHRWEYLFMFTPNRQYSFNLDSVREPYSEATKKRLAQNGGNPNFDPETDRGHVTGETNQVEVDQFTHENGKNPGDVWTIPSGKFSKGHFAVYPKKLCKKPIKAGSPEEGVVLDPFAGAGTTCLVAQELNRNYIGIELNPEYAQIARERIETHQN